MRSYRLTCSAGDELVAELSVERNEASNPLHALSCRSADRLRIQYDTEPGTSRDVARLYEIEVVP